MMQSTSSMTISREQVSLLLVMFVLVNSISYIFRYTHMVDVLKEKETRTGLRNLHSNYGEGPGLVTGITTLKHYLNYL